MGLDVSLGRAAAAGHDNSGGCPGDPWIYIVLAVSAVIHRDPATHVIVCTNLGPVPIGTGVEQQTRIYFLITHPGCVSILRDGCWQRGRDCRRGPSGGGGVGVVGSYSLPCLGHPPSPDYFSPSPVTIYRGFARSGNIVRGCRHLLPTAGGSSRQAGGTSSVRIRLAGSIGARNEDAFCSRGVLANSDDTPILPRFPADRC